METKDSLYNKKRSLKDFCRNATNLNGDTFVGVSFDYDGGNQALLMTFPLGYNISTTDFEIREDIIKLFMLLERYGDKKSNLPPKYNNSEVIEKIFPFQSFYHVLIHYLSYGYHEIKEDSYKSSLTGSINWSRTLKKEKPIISNSNFIYTTFQTKHSNNSDNDLITEINKYCVYLSILYIGWLFNLPLVNEPSRNYDNDIYARYLQNYILKTNNDDTKKLFESMLDIILYAPNSMDQDSVYFGTNNFEYIWESLIQETYGNVDKNYYFPNTTWKLKNHKIKYNRALEPDTVMKKEKDIYILDAKYYKYGVTLNLYDLPNSSSINKQIIYAEYVVQNEKFTKSRENGMNVYNAFIMPFNSMDGRAISSKYYSIGEATAEWKSSKEDYQRVQGILVDVKFLINNTIHPNFVEINKLAEEILTSLAE